MGGCSVFKCSSSSTKGQSVFRLPKSPSTRAEWLKFLQMSGRKICNDVEYCVCELHFRPDQIKFTKKTKKLHLGSVPSILVEELTPDVRGK